MNISLVFSKSVWLVRYNDRHGSDLSATENGTTIIFKHFEVKGQHSYVSVDYKHFARCCYKIRYPKQTCKISLRIA